MRRGIAQESNTKIREIQSRGQKIKLFVKRQIANLLFLFLSFFVVVVVVVVVWLCWRLVTLMNSAVGA